MKQLLPCFLSHPWVDCKEAADGADGRAECGKRGTSWEPSCYRYRKSATAVRRVTDVPTVLPSSIFNFVPGTSPSWSPKVCVSDGRTPYIIFDSISDFPLQRAGAAIKLTRMGPTYGHGTAQPASLKAPLSGLRLHDLLLKNHFVPTRVNLVMS